MSQPSNDRSDAPDVAETLPQIAAETPGALSVPPPVPQDRPGFFRRLFSSRKKQQALAVQNGYLEMVDLIRAIRSHLDRQETVQTHVLSMLEKVPETMDRQHEVLAVFKQQLDNNMENDRRLTDSMGRLSGTLEAINESSKSSSRTIADLIARSRESEQLLREVMRRSERRMAMLIAFFALLVLGTGYYLVHWKAAEAPPPAPAAAAAPAEVPAPDPVAAPVAASDPEPIPVAEEIVPTVLPDESDIPGDESTDFIPADDDAVEFVAESPSDNPPESQPETAVVPAQEPESQPDPVNPPDTPAEPVDQPPALVVPSPDADSADALPSDLDLQHSQSAIGQMILDEFSAKEEDAPVSIP